MNSPDNRASLSRSAIVSIFSLPPRLKCLNFMLRHRIQAMNWLRNIPTSCRFHSHLNLLWNPLNADMLKLHSSHRHDLAIIKGEDKTKSALI